MRDSELPEGWDEAPIGVLCMDIEQRVPAENEKFFYIDIGSVDRNTKAITRPTELLGIDAPSRARKCVRQGDVLVSMTRPNLNAVALVPPELDGHIGSTGFDVLRCPDLDCRWLFFLVRSQEFVDSMSNLVQGALYPAVKARDIRSFVIPVAPINEQRRITASLETTLAAVDACRQRLDGVAAILRRFRQAVLAAATTGGLTRESAEESPWKNISIKEVCEVVRGASPRPAGDKRYFGGTGSIPWITVGELTKDGSKHLLSTSCFLTEEGKTRSRYIYPGTLLLTNSGATLGIPKITLIGGCINDGSVALLGLEEPLKSYIYYVLLSMTQELRAINQGAAQPNLNTSIVKGIRFKLPIDTNEQTEVVRRIEELLVIADQLEAKLTVARKIIERLTHALLAKAFRGELVPQDPNDEPASVLLERIRTARQADAAAGKSSGRARRKTLAHSELSSLAPTPVPTDEPSRVFLVRTGDETIQGERGPSRVSKPKPTDNLKGWSPMQKDLIQILEQHQSWISASTACEEMGISDGSSSDDLELFYRQLKEQVEDGVVDVQRRGDEDWIRLSSREVA